MRNLDRDITGLKRAEDKAKKECQKLAKTGNLKAAKILAKEIVSLLLWCAILFIYQQYTWYTWYIGILSYQCII